MIFSKYCICMLIFGLSLWNMWFGTCLINSLAPGRRKSYFTGVFFKLIIRIDILIISYNTDLQRVPQNPMDDKSGNKPLPEPM